jgi:hypothetical protein
MGSLSLTNEDEMQCSWTISVINTSYNDIAVYECFKGGKGIYSDKWLTTTKITSKYFPVDNLVMKSIERSSQILEGNGKACKRPSGEVITYLNLLHWQVSHSWTYF